MHGHARGGDEPQKTKFELGSVAENHRPPSRAATKSERVSNIEQDVLARSAPHQRMLREKLIGFIS